MYVRTYFDDSSLHFFSIDNYYSVQRPPQFDAWIDMYAGEDFEMKVKEYIAIVEAVCQTVDDAELKEMERHFLMSCKLEHMFWDQASNRMQWPEIGGL
jgi:thiaminase/transcriptional activator TenA